MLLEARFVRFTEIVSNCTWPVGPHPKDLQFLEVSSFSFSTIMLSIM